MVEASQSPCSVVVNVAGVYDTSLPSGDREVRDKPFLVGGDASVSTISQLDTVTPERSHGARGKR